MHYRLYSKIWAMAYWFEPQGGELNGKMINAANRCDSWHELDFHSHSFSFFFRRRAQKQDIRKRIKNKNKNGEWRSWRKRKRILTRLDFIFHEIAKLPQATETEERDYELTTFCLASNLWSEQRLLFGQKQWIGNRDWKSKGKKKGNVWIPVKTWESLSERNRERERGIPYKRLIGFEFRRSWMKQSEEHGERGVEVAEIRRSGDKLRYHNLHCRWGRLFEAAVHYYTVDVTGERGIDKDFFNPLRL